MPLYLAINKDGQAILTTKKPVLKEGKWSNTPVLKTIHKERLEQILGKNWARGSLYLFRPKRVKPKTKKSELRTIFYIATNEFGEAFFFVDKPTFSKTHNNWIVNSSYSPVKLSDYLVHYLFNSKKPKINSLYKLVVHPTSYEPINKLLLVNNWLQTSRYYITTELNIEDDENAVDGFRWNAWKHNTLIDNIQEEDAKRIAKTYFDRFGEQYFIYLEFKLQKVKE